MGWIKEFAKASFSLYAGNTVSAFQPLDFFHFYGLWYSAWLERVVQAMAAIKAERKSYRELAAILPTPSNLRALIQKAIPAYLGSNRRPKELYRRYVNFLARMLNEACPEDPFGLSRTPLHTRERVEQIVATTDWREATPDEARALGKLITAAGSLVHGLYNDVVTDFAWDTYGPYENVVKDGRRYTLLVRNFPDLRPEGLWPPEVLPRVGTIEIRQLYQNVSWAIGCVGCHTIVKHGDPIRGLKYWTATADGQPLERDVVADLTRELAPRAENIYEQIRRKNFEELKALVMLQECYQLRLLLEAAGMDWRPTDAMRDMVRGKALLTGLVPLGEMMESVEQYTDAFGVRRFASEVLGEKI